MSEEKDRHTGIDKIKEFGTSKYFKNRHDVAAAELVRNRFVPNNPIQTNTIIPSSQTHNNSQKHLTALQKLMLKHFLCTILEPFDFLVTSNGTVITGTLTPSAGAGDLNLVFSFGIHTLDADPGVTVTLNAGISSAPQFQYIYILATDPNTLVVNNTSYPSGVEYIPIGKVMLATAAITQTDGGAYLNQNDNNEAADNNNIGHKVHEGVKHRRRSDYISGLDPEAANSDNYLDIDTVPAPDTVFFRMQSGAAQQMHEHTIPAYDSETDIIMVKNYPSDSYKRGNNLFTLVDVDSNNVALATNKYYILVFWVTLNKTGDGFNNVMVNLPNAGYTNLTNAIRDTDDTADFKIPAEYTTKSSTAVLVCKQIIKKTVTSWTDEPTGYGDLRGDTPASAGGGATGYTDAQAIAAARTDLLDESDLATDSHTQAATQGSVKDYVDQSIKLYAPSIQVYMFSDTIQSTKNRFPVIQFPATDVDCGAIWSFHIPDTWSVDKVSINIRFSIPATSGTYSVKFYAGAAIDGANINTFQDNLINADTTNDFAATGISDEVQTKTLAVDDTNLDVGGFMAFTIQSDASNAALLRVYEVWLEPDYT